MADLDGRDGGTAVGNNKVYTTARSADPADNHSTQSVPACIPITTRASGAAARRETAQLAKWRSEKTTPRPAHVRKRERHFPQNTAADVILQHNTWDDVTWDEDEVARAENIISGQELGSAEAASAALSKSAAFWDAHYAVNLRNYHDRHYLHNEFPEVLGGAEMADAGVVILESGCGVGNTMLPLLTAYPNCRIVGFDISTTAVHFLQERLQREGLESRARAFVADLRHEFPAAEVAAAPYAHVALAVFTLSALPPDSLPTALSSLRSCLLPDGRLLLRDYGKLDLKQLKYARVTGARLHDAQGREWYSRGDGTTVHFLTEEAVRQLAAQTGFEVERVGYDRRLVINRADKTRMQRVWLVAVLRKPSAVAQPQRRQKPRVSFHTQRAASPIKGLFISPIWGFALAKSAAWFVGAAVMGGFLAVAYARRVRGSLLRLRLT